MKASAVDIDGFNSYQLKNYFMRIHKLNFLIPVMVSIIFQSCAEIHSAIEASGDLTNRKYDGDSYPDASTDNANMGFNVGFILWLREVLQTQSQSSAFLLRGGNCSDVPKIMRQGNTGQLFQKMDSEISDHPVFSSNQGANAPEANSKNSFRVLTGLMYVQKNSKDDFVKVNAGYLEIPVYAIYYHQMVGDAALFGGLGPYIAYGIGGKTKGDNFSEKTFDKDFGFKPFDAGVSFTGGYQFPMGLSIRLAYDLGLADIDRNEVDNAKNRSFSFNIGYPIGKIFKK